MISDQSIAIYIVSAETSLKNKTDLRSLYMYYKRKLITTHHIIIKKIKMNLLKRAIVDFSSLYAPTRGRILIGKWEKVIQLQKSHNQQWK